MSTVADCRLIELPRITSSAGNLTPVEGGMDVPFAIERVYYLYDVPGGATRGGHAHLQLEQLIIAVMGAVDLTVDDGTAKRTLRLERAHQGLLVPRMIWRELTNFSSGAICMVLASRPYEEGDYIRDYAEFLECRSGLP